MVDWGAFPSKGVECSRLTMTGIPVGWLGPSGAANRNLGSDREEMRS
jgi:hypothetical protein